MADGGSDGKTDSGTEIGLSHKIAWLFKRKIIEISLAVGSLAFIAILIGVSDLFRLIVAIGVALISGVACFTLLTFAFKNIRPIRKKRKDGSIEAHSEFSGETQSLSIHTFANYELTPDKRANQKDIGGPLTPREWSSYLIETIEWRIFDRLCVAYWRVKGNSISGIAERAQDGIDFFISAPKRKSLRIGVVQTRSVFSAAPNIEDIRALITLKEKNNLSVAILMYAGRLSQVTHSYCIRNNVRLINSINLAKGLQSLTKKEQDDLMKSLIRPDYKIPSCPACLIKLVKRQKRNTGKLFWGCVCYPVCRFTLDHM